VKNYQFFAVPQITMVHRPTCSKPTRLLSTDHILSLIVKDMHVHSVTHGQWSYVRHKRQACRPEIAL